MDELFDCDVDEVQCPGPSHDGAPVAASCSAGMVLQVWCLYANVGARMYFRVRKIGSTVVFIFIYCRELSVYTGAYSERRYRHDVGSRSRG